jgi:cytochrome c oxidase subunit 2
VRYWSIIFGLAAVFAVACFVYSPFSPDWDVPLAGSPPHVISKFGREIDSLYYMILGITGIVFIGTQIVLVVALYRFGDERDAEGRPVRNALYFHGSQYLEVIWTIIPAAILVFIAFIQMGIWTSIKFKSAAPRVPPLAEVTARQFQWVIRYPGPDGKLNTRDDLFAYNDLHFVKNKQALIYLKSSDVIHSFYLPHLRIKQDAVPGLSIPVWFDSDTSGEFELVCAELCGWGHYKMRGRVTIHETQAEFEKWLGDQIAEQNRSQLSMTAGSQGR